MTRYRFGISGTFMLIFLISAAAFSIAAIWQGRAGAAPLAPMPVIKGEWTPLYEKNFSRKLYTYNGSRDGWGAINYAFFREGNEGVLVGADGWLFTKEEFDHQPAQQENIRKNMAYIYAVNDYFKTRDIELVIVPVPSKARIYHEKLGRYEFPAYKENVYSNLVSDLRAYHIHVVDVMVPMSLQKSSNNLFLKTDTHWTPGGALITAQSVARYISRKIPLKFEKAGYETALDKTENYKGDLLRYIPVGNLSAQLRLPEDRLPVFQTVESGIELAAGDTADLLFSEKSPPITLVGTSYSANPKWNFEGFLKQSLQTDILNAADGGLGPLETMDKYLKNQAFKDTPPQLVIWEIPERYLSFSYDLKTDFTSDGV